MLKMKKKKITALCCALALVGTCSFPAFATGYKYKFDFFGKGECYDSTEYKYDKEDTEQNAYVSIKSSDNWSKGIDRVYMWVNANGSTATSTNKYFTDYVTNEKLPYSKYAGKHSECYLLGWHKNYNSDKEFSVGGNWAP